MILGNKIPDHNLGNSILFLELEIYIRMLKIFTNQNLFE